MFSTLFSLSQKELLLPAIYLDKESLSYKELLEKIETLASFLKNEGLSSHTRIAFIPTLSLSSILLFFSLLQIGASPCLLSSRLPQEKISIYLEQARCSFFIDEKTLSIQKLPQEKDCSSQEILLFTSGSSKAPKLVSLNPSHFLANAEGALNALHFTPEKSSWLLCVPLFHVSGLSILFRSFSSKNAVALTSRPLEGHPFATHISFVPTQLLRILENKASYPLLKCALIGGAPLSENLIKLSLNKKLPLFITYGMTEMASQITMTNAEDNLLPPHVGKPLPGREINLSEDGEILVRGSCLFTGYDSFSGPQKLLTKDGWFATGDLGAFDEQRNLKHLGRKDNLFISGGENIYPEVIEEAICSLPNVLECLVIPIEDVEFGQRPIAFVHMHTPLPSKQEFHERLSTLLPRFSLPIDFLSFPLELREQSFKIKRADLKNWLQTKTQRIFL